MAEVFVEHIWAMIGVFAATVAVFFAIRGGGHKATPEHGSESS